MNIKSQTRLIESLGLAAPPARRVTRGRAGVSTNKSAKDEKVSGFIAGGNMVAFPDDIPSASRSAVTLSLLLAQEAAKGDPVAISPDLWVERHDMVLRSLGWVSTGGATQYTEYKKVNLSVHQAILPLLAAALGPAATAGALIITGLTQLQEIDKDKPWITLFDKESRRFDHSEYRFVTAEKQDSSILLRVVAFRFAAKAQRFQVLFFKTKDVEIEFTVATRTLAANTDMLEKLRIPLEAKLEDRANQLINAIDLPAFA